MSTISAGFSLKENGTTTIPRQRYYVPSSSVMGELSSNDFGWCKHSVSLCGHERFKSFLRSFIKVMLNKDRVLELKSSNSAPRKVFLQCDTKCERLEPGMERAKNTPIGASTWVRIIYLPFLPCIHIPVIGYVHRLTVLRAARLQCYRLPRISRDDARACLSSVTVSSGTRQIFFWNSIPALFMGCRN